MDVLVLRHGRTAFNATRRLQGQLDVPLDAAGRAQARALRDDLRDEGLTRVVSSDLRRARATAQAVGLPVLLDARLREQHYGRWQGLTHDQVRAGWPQRYADWSDRHADPVGGEPLVDVADRALAAVREHLPAAGTLLVVTHGDTARALLGRLCGLPQQAWAQLPPLENCTWVRSKVDDLAPTA